jgi:uncharacterized membrane protein
LLKRVHPIVAFSGAVVKNSFNLTEFLLRNLLEVISFRVVAGIFGGVVTGQNLVGILLVVLGIIAASGIIDIKKSDRKLSRGIFYALLTFLIWGFGYAFIGKAVSLIGWQKATFVDIWFELILILILLPLLLKKDDLHESFRLARDKFVIATTIIQLFGAIIFDYGLTKASSAAVITAISATYPVLTVFLALRHFNEKRSLVPLIGVFVTVIGIVVLSLG